MKPKTKRKLKWGSPSISACGDYCITKDRVGMFHAMHLGHTIDITITKAEAKAFCELHAREKGRK